MERTFTFILSKPPSIHFYLSEIYAESCIYPFFSTVFIWRAHLNCFAGLLLFLPENDLDNASLLKQRRTWEADYLAQIRHQMCLDF